MSGLERQAKCEDPEYQRNPINNSIYDPFIVYFDSETEDQIIPVNTFYPHGTVCYVDKSGGKLHVFATKVYKFTHVLCILGSCPEFGVSGSGIVREWRRRPENGPAIDSYEYIEYCNDYGYGDDEDEEGSSCEIYDQETDPQYQHSFVGPLSMSKGCDLTLDYTLFRENTKIPEFIYRGKCIQ